MRFPSLLLVALALVAVGASQVVVPQGKPDFLDVTVKKIARGVMTRLHAEVTRTINFYRSQQGGNAPSRVLASRAEARAMPKSVILAQPSSPLQVN